MMTIQLSIIIATYNRHESLARTLDALSQQELAGCEVIVVDQSPDAVDKAEQLKKRYPGFTFLKRAKPGLTAARNFGILNSKGTVLLFLDDDAVPRGSCLEEHLRPIRQGKALAVAGRIIQKGTAHWPESAVVTAIDPTTGEAIGNFDLDYEGPVLYACGCNMSLAREALITAGLFEEHFRGNALFEDVELFHRLRKNGGTTWYNPAAVAEHYHEPAGGCRSDKGADYLIDRIHNLALFYTRHLNALPRIGFLRHVRNIAEFAARRPDKSHDPRVLYVCAIAFAAGCLHGWGKPKGPSLPR
ncbi:MAG: glycosyltransferase family 2 protein [Chitinivibrionales bacterium]|nr:glycosyltransferase family 2 protein [Chitinivibrionales bacterium]